ncbi:MAG: MMPL family transporter [Solirubrobacteraceae bacterium]
MTVQTGGTEFTNQTPSEISEMMGILAALIVLLLVFRSAWAAALPIVTGVAGWWFPAWRSCFSPT